jgi:hypothetical protein
MGSLLQRFTPVLVAPAAGVGRVHTDHGDAASRRFPAASRSGQSGTTQSCICCNNTGSTGNAPYSLAAERQAACGRGAFVYQPAGSEINRELRAFASATRLSI